MITLKILASIVIIVLAFLWYFLEVYWKRPSGVVVWMVPTVIIMTAIVAIGAIWTSL